MVMTSRRGSFLKPFLCNEVVVKVEKKESLDYDRMENHAAASTLDRCNIEDAKQATLPRALLCSSAVGYRYPCTPMFSPARERAPSK